jgi:hypothetical protein
MRKPKRLSPHESDRAVFAALIVTGRADTTLTEAERRDAGRCSSMAKRMTAG